VTDNNIPFNESGTFDSLSVASLAVLDGSLCASSACGCSGVPWMFNLTRRDPFLNPYCCCYYNSVQHFGPYHFGQEPAPLYTISSEQGRILGGSDNGSEVYSISPSGFQVLATGLGRPRGVAAFPPDLPTLSAAAMAIRIDSPVNVLLTD